MSKVKYGGRRVNGDKVSRMTQEVNCTDKMMHRHK